MAKLLSCLSREEDGGGGRNSAPLGLLRKYHQAPLDKLETRSALIMPPFRLIQLDIVGGGHVRALSRYHSALLEFSGA
jgi:hypothetical protein